MLTRPESEIVLLIGFQASGKTGVAAEFVNAGYARFNRDEKGGKVDDLLPEVNNEIQWGNKRIIADNTFPTVASRKPWIELAAKYGFPIRCLWMQTDMDEAQVNMCIRMYKSLNYLPTPEEIKASKDPGMVPIAAMYAYKRDFKKPTIDEGFSEIEKIPFTRIWGAEHKNKALILDADSTLREVPDGCATKWPTDPDHVVIMPNRKETIARYAENGYRLLGVSNQSGVAKNNPPAAVAEACYARTNELLGHSIEWRYCPHSPVGGISCYCRKPIPGLGVYFILKYNLDPSQTIYVGDKTEDRTFAGKCGFQFVDAEEFFKL